jgi:hypothetical protein
MSFDSNNTPVLYSICTLLAYRISQQYYNKVHYVWCTTKFDSLSQPPTANPQTIARRYLEQVTKGDRHATEIDKNIAGILNGAKSKLSQGVINEKQYEDIRSIVANSWYEAFFPVIYIIYSDKVKDKCIKVNEYDCASDSSIEYKIVDLEESEFGIINLKDVTFGIAKAVDKKAGE